MSKSKENLGQEIKDYLKHNLSLNLKYIGNNTLVTELKLEGKVISESYVHYKIKN